MTLFKWGGFTGASGKYLPFKIDCDALTNDDWKCIANIVFQQINIPFKTVYGVPSGGFKFAESLIIYEDPTASNILIVDDVWTSGIS